MSDTPIGDHGLLSDRHGLMLVDRAGTITWWCPRRPDGPAVFARLLDEDAGHWSLLARQAQRSHRRYLPDSLLLETTTETATGTLVRLDGLTVGPDDRGHDLGATSPCLAVRG